MTSLLHLGLAGLLSMGVAGCTDDRSTPGAGPACNSPGCLGMGQTSGNGSGGSGSGSGGGSSGDVGDIQGTVRVMADPAFVLTQSTAWEGEATIVAEPDSGQPIEVAYSDKAFLLEDVPEGDAWLIVRDEQGGAGVLSTVTAVEVPHSDLIVAPIVALEMLENVADTLVGAPQVEEGSGHIVVFLARDDHALAGVSVDPGSVPGAVVAYDNGDSDVYSNDLDSTGDLGKILILNASTPAGGKLVLDVVDGEGNTFPLDIRVFPNAIAVVGYTLPSLP